MKLKNKKIIVTGGSGGIGSIITEMLLSNGAIVGCIDQNQESLDILSDKNKSYLKNFKTYCIDIKNSESVTSMVSEFYDEFGEIDVLVNNAAILDDCLLVSIFGGKVTKHPIDRWNNTIETNLTSYFVFTREVTEKMILKRTKGLILNISSISSSGNSGQSSYSASKAAINALTVTWSQELSRFGIRVAGISPGMTDTAMPRTSMNDSMLKEWIEKTPINRMATPEEIAHSAKYIIENEFFCGRILEIDGGLRM